MDPREPELRADRPPGVYDAVLPADPRVADPSAAAALSGVARTMTLVVLIEGEEPVTTATLTAILIAVRDATSSSIETVTLIAREAADEERKARRRRPALRCHAAVGRRSDALVRRPRQAHTGGVTS